MSLLEWPQASQGKGREVPPLSPLLMEAPFSSSGALPEGARLSLSVPQTPQL